MSPCQARSIVHVSSTIFEVRMGGSVALQVSGSGLVKRGNATTATDCRPVMSGSESAGRMDSVSTDRYVFSTHCPIFCGRRSGR